MSRRALLLASAAPAASDTFTVVGFDASTTNYVYQTTNGGTSWSLLGTFTSANGSGLGGHSMPNSGYKSGSTYLWHSNPGSTSYIVKTTDFSSFSASGSVSSISTNGTCYDGSTYVVGRTTLISNYSTDLSAWTATASGTGNIASIAKLGTTWVAVGGITGPAGWYQTGSLPSSAWTAATTQMTGASGSMRHVISSGGKFVAVGGVGSSSAASFYSYDGINWAAGSVTASDRLESVAFNGSLWVAVGGAANGVTGIVRTSTDGQTWTSRTAPSGGLYSVSWNGSTWCVVGANAGAGVCYTTSDPTSGSWTSAGLSSSAQSYRTIITDIPSGSAPASAPTISGLTDSGDYSSANITFSSVSGATMYEYRSTRTFPLPTVWEFTGRVSSPGNILTGDGHIYVQVRAVNAYGASAWSSTSEVDVAAAP